MSSLAPMHFQVNLVPVFQLKSPLRNFFRETGSLLKAESSALNGRKTWSMVCRSVLLVLWRLGCYAREMKSSTNMSTYSKGSPVVGRDGSCVSRICTAAPESQSPVGMLGAGNGTAAAILSR